MYTIDDLERAQKELDRWHDAFANDSSNNPNKYQAQIRDAAIQCRGIQQYLKNIGTIKKSESEKLTEELDTLHPNAKSKTVVTYRGQKYQIS